MAGVTATKAGLPSRMMRSATDLTHHLDYRTRLRRHLALWDWYEALGRVAAAAGTRVVNATPGSFLDVFERADFAQVVGGGDARAD